jgi:hypothetical protein
MKTTSCEDFLQIPDTFLLLLLLLRLIIIIITITIQTQKLMSDLSTDQRIVTKCMTILILVTPSPWNARTNPQRQKTKRKTVAAALHCIALPCR